MARIRTIKPEFFKHEDLFELELETGLPVRLAFIGLWTISDRDGRFKWRPRQIKTDVLPYDNCDFSRVLDALWSRGFIQKYVSGRDEYGYIPSFTAHQVINNRESASTLPDPYECETIPFEIRDFDASATREERVSDAQTTPLEHAQGEGKGREGKGKGRERKEGSAAVPATATRKKAEPNPLNLATWEAYAAAFFDRYGTEPVRNAKTNSQIANLVKRLGEEAPEIAAFYVSHNKGWYVQKMHAVDYLLSDAESLRTQWATNTQMTESKARTADRLGNAGARMNQLQFNDEERF